MRSEGKVQDESFILHSRIAHLLGADPVPGKDLETDRQQSPSSGWEADEDTVGDLFSYTCWGSQGTLEQGCWDERGLLGKDGCSLRLSLSLSVSLSLPTLHP